MKIRPSIDSDLPLIAAIYAHHVLHGTGTFETSAPSVEEMAQRRSDVLAKGLPYLVLEDQSQILGFAYCNWFKPRPAYRFSAEDSIYLAPEAMGRRLGTLLLTELIAHAERKGIRKLIAVIGDSSNKASVGVHTHCGFQPVGRLQSCGWKFDRWLDVVLMERTLGQGDQTAPPSTPAN